MGAGDIAVVLLVMGGAYILIKSGKLQEIIQQGGFQLPIPTLAPTAPQIQPPPIRGGTKTVPAPPAPTGGGGGGPSASTGTSIYKVVGSIASGGGVTLRGGGTSNRDNLGYPCNKCARESTWIFKPGTGGDYSLKLGSHGDEGGKETLIELGNIGTNSGGGEWKCEGPHMTYKGVSGGSGSGPAIGGKPRVGLKGISWPTGANAVHHEVWYDETGAGNSWKKVAEFTGSATGCNAITCPVPGSKCQDTLRLDNVQGHQFISRSIVEIVPGAGAVGGGGAPGAPAATGPRKIGDKSSAPAPTTPAAKREIKKKTTNYARRYRAYDRILSRI